MINDSEEIVHYPTRRVIKDLWGYVRLHKGIFIGATILRAIADLAFIYTPYAFASMVDFLTTFERGTPLRPLWVIFALWNTSYFIRFFGIRGGKFLGYKMAEKIALNIQEKGLSHATKLDISWHEQENVGNKLKRIQKGSEGVYRLLALWFDNIIKTAIQFTGMTIVIATLDHSIAIVLIVFVVTYYLISRPLTKKASVAAQVVNQKEEDLSGLLFEILNNVRSVKVMGMQPRLISILKEYGAALYGKIKTRITRFQMRGVTLSSWSQVVRLFLAGFIVWGIVEGRYEIGFLLLVNMYFTNLRDATEELSDASQEFAIARYGFYRLQMLLQEPTHIDNENGKVDFPVDWKRVELKNVSFAYGDNQVLKNVSFEINRGERIGIVGLSGAGKSTLFKLLLKENEEFTGDILFDNVSIKNIKKSSFQIHTAVVLQETEVFNFSLRDNITIANNTERNNEELLSRSSKIAHVNDFVKKLPEGFETLIGEKGIKLSGGEKQRVGIARAIFKEPQILFLDEATSHLDLESEEKIQDSLHQFFRSVTAIVIAHRLTTIKEMDRILVVENGTVIESGNFDELYRLNGRFFELWEKQGL